MGLNDPAGNAPGRWLQLTTWRVLMKLILHFEISGVEYIPAAGPAVIIINHIAFLDPIVVFGGVSRRVVPMAKAEAYDFPIWGLFMKVYGTIPVHRGEADMNAIKQALRMLKAGHIVLVAPEGTRSLTYQMQPAKDGATLLALKSGAPIIPIGVTGTHQVKRHWQKFKRAPVHLAVGEPFYIQPPAANGRLARQEISAVTQEIMCRLAALLPPEYRGVYSNLEKAPKRYLIPAMV